MSHYDTLDISKGATQDDIKKAYRKLANKYHPDKPSGDEDRFKKIKEAYEVLSDQQKRKLYDTYGSTTPNQQRSSYRTWTSEDVNDIFRTYGFGDIFGQGVGRRPQGFSMGPDGPVQRVDVPLSMMFSGGVLKTQVMRQKNFNPNTDNISITSEIRELIIPANARVDQQLSLDIDGVKHTFVIRPKAHGEYVISGLDIAKAIRMDALSHIAGMPQNILHPSGKTKRVRIPPNLKDGQMISLKKEGLTSQNGFKGDFLIEVHLTIPDLSVDEKKRIGEFLRSNIDRYKT